MHLDPEGNWIAFLIDQDINTKLLILFVSHAPGAMKPGRLYWSENYVSFAADSYIARGILTGDGDKWRRTAEQIAALRSELEAVDMREGHDQAPDPLERILRRHHGLPREQTREEWLARHARKKARKNRRRPVPALPNEAGEQTS